MARSPKYLLALPVDDWTEADWMDLYTAMEWVKRRVCARHGIKTPPAAKLPACDPSCGEWACEKCPIKPEDHNR